jgi:RimJ/RimL family protein N-acetyltransferase
MGVPTMVLVLAENQRRVAEGLEQAGVSVNLGWFDKVSSREIANVIGDLLVATEWRQRVSYASQKLVDGNGSSRVVHTMSTLNNTDPLDRLNFRLATIKDAISLWELANSSAVRTNSFNSDPIPFDRHLEWFQNKLSSHNTRIWVLEYDGNVVAQVRYDHTDADTAEIDFSVASTLRGKGLGARALVLTRLPACEELRVKRLRGVVFASNLPSSRAFIKAGFKQIANAEHVHGRSCSVFEWVCKGEP